MVKIIKQIKSIEIYQVVKNGQVIYTAYSLNGIKSYLLNLKSAA